MLYVELIIPLQWITGIILNPFTELFFANIVLCNIVFMAMDHNDIEENYSAEGIEKVNNVFRWIFTAECILKLIASFKKYFQSICNQLDL